MKYNKTVSGYSFNLNTINLVWEKAQSMAGDDEDIWRKDTCGAIIKRSEYGNTNSSYDWEIDHIKPKSKGGFDNSNNLQPLQWANNRYKGDNFPEWFCNLRD